MSRVYKTARGKMIDIDKVKLANENVIAVGNMKINARGDQIGAMGEVAKGRNQVMDQVYAVPSAGFSPNDPANFSKQQATVEASKAKELHDLATNLATPTTNLEPATESVAPTVRGSLASSVAKTVSVTQKATPSPQEQAKSKGPSRI